MPKAVSFASALDPAFLIVEDQAEGSKTKDNLKRTSSRNGKNNEQSSDQISSNIGTTPEEKFDLKSGKKGKEKMIERNTVIRKPARLQIATPGESPLLQKFTSLPSKALAADETGDITESIYDISTTSTGWEKSNNLAKSLLAEKECQINTKRQFSKQKISGLERRTSYGSKKRKLDRQSRRSIRNPSMDQEIGTEDHSEEISKSHTPSSVIVTSLSQNDADLIKEDLALPSFSQQSHLSIESDDGVYHTQFSFFHFESENTEDGKLDEGSSLQNEIEKNAEDRSLKSDSISSSLQRATQSAYDADRSASWTASYPSSMNHLTEQDSSNSHSTTIQERELRMNQTVQTDDLILNQSSDECVVKDVKQITGEETVEQKMIKAICSEKKDNEHATRFVYPTIWKGKSKVQEYFGPLLNPFVPARSPPARDDVRRWAEWQDSQSDEDNGQQTSALYDYEGKISDIPIWSDKDKI